MCEYGAPESTFCENKNDYIYKSCDRVKLKLAEMLQQPSISELNDRLDNILTSKKYETQLNDTLKENIRNCINEYYEKINDEKLSLNDKLNENKRIINDLVISLTSSGVKIRSNQFIRGWFDNLTKFEESLSIKQVNEIDRLKIVLNEKTGELDELNGVYEKKQKEIEDLKANFDKLNDNYTLLNENLFDIKHSNLNIKEDINSLRQQIEFYKKSLGDNKKNFTDNSLNHSFDSNIGSIFSSISSNDASDQMSSTTSSGICLKQIRPQMSTSTSTSSLTSVSLHLSDIQFDEGHEDYYKSELSIIRNDIRAEFEIFMNSELDIFEDGCEADFYEKLHEEEMKTVRLDKIEDEQYQEMSNDISKLNDEYLENLSEFIQLNDANSRLSERLVNISENLVKFSKSSSSKCDLIMVKYSLSSLKRHIETTKVDVEKFELRLKNLKNLLFNKNIDYILNENLLLKSIKTVVPINQLRSMLSMNSNLLSQQLFEVLYTQTNTFGYVQFNFNLNHKTSSINVIQNKIDTSVLTIENLDKVLDLDLSEWILRREIYSSLKTKKEFEQIEFKFPKGFKLKRRRKVVLLSTSAKLADYHIASIPIKNPLKGTVVGLPKGIFQSKIKDVDLYICNNIQNWGCGLQMATKLINNKNITKYVNYRSFKSIWLNLV